MNPPAGYLVRRKNRRKNARGLIDFRRMITLFSIPKAFRGHIGVIQRNAIRSWSRLRPACEIVLFGDDEGTAEMAAEIGARHISQVGKNEYGTPLIDDIFRQAQEAARFERLCYVNADIVLTNDLTKALERLTRLKKPYVAVGHRWDYDQTEELDFADGWDEKICAEARAKGAKQRDWLIDYFCFPRGLFGEIPAFAIGRAVWDNWLLYRTREAKALLVDLSPIVVAVHQNHDYGHVKNGMQGAYKGPEAMRNLELAGGEEHCFSLKDVTHELTRDGLRRALDRDRFKRYLKRAQILHPGWKWLAGFTDRFFRAPARLVCQCVDALTYPRM